MEEKRYISFEDAEEWFAQPENAASPKGIICSDGTREMRCGNVQEAKTFFDGFTSEKQRPVEES